MYGNHGFFVENPQNNSIGNGQQQQQLNNQENHSTISSSPEKPMKREKRKYRCRKRSPATIERAKVVRRDKANARERRRMNSLNDALEHLRTILPSLPDEPKMTKIETLRKAQEYIATLSMQLSGSSGLSPTSSESPEHHHVYESSSCSSSVHTTPFQSPCFPLPLPQLQYPNYSNPMMGGHGNSFYSPHFPKN